MNLRNIVLSLFVLACGGSTTGSSSDGSLDCRVNCMQDSGNNQKDGNVSSDGCCRYDGSLDGGKDGKLDGSYDGNNTSDGSSDSGVNDGSTDGPIDYPVAVLACNEWADDGLCIHRPVKEQIYCWDASGSQAGPGRTLVEYRIYGSINDNPNSYIWTPQPEICSEYGTSGTFLAKSRVIDDLGDFDDQEFYNIVFSEN